LINEGSPSTAVGVSGGERLFDEIDMGQIDEEER
jgi:hypothetical protein